MKHIPYSGMSDEEIIDFFRNPFEAIFLTNLEGNRLFEIEILSRHAGSICVCSEMVDIAERDEIGVMDFRFGKTKDRKLEIKLNNGANKAISLYKIVGDIGDGQSCDCGIVIELPNGMVSILSGSFPTSLNLICPDFNQGLMVNSFQRFKYYMSKLKIY